MFTAVDNLINIPFYKPRYEEVSAAVNINQILRPKVDEIADKEEMKDILQRFCFIAKLLIPGLKAKDQQCNHGTYENDA